MVERAVRQTVSQVKEVALRASEAVGGAGAFQAGSRAGLAREHKAGVVEGRALGCADARQKVGVGTFGAVGEAGTAEAVLAAGLALQVVREREVAFGASGLAAGTLQVGQVRCCVTGLAGSGIEAFSARSWAGQALHVAACHRKGVVGGGTVGEAGGIGLRQEVARGAGEASCGSGAGEAGQKTGQAETSRSKRVEGGRAIRKAEVVVEMVACQAALALHSRETLGARGSTWLAGGG